MATSRARCGRWQYVGGAGGAVAVTMAVTVAVAVVVGVCECFMQLTHVGPQRRHLGGTVRRLPPRLTYLSSENEERQYRHGKPKERAY